MSFMAYGAAQTQMSVGDYQQAMTIGTQTQAEVKKETMRRWQIEMDTRTKINEITQDVALNKAKTGDKISQQFSAFMRS